MKRSVLFAIFCVGLLCLANRDVGLDFADEGHYWHGVDSVRQGFVPVRDFQAYMPARYYWGAAWSHLFGSGPSDLRYAAALFQALCLSLGLFALSVAIGRGATLFLFSVMATLWMMLYFRYVETGLPLTAFFFAANFALKPEAKRASWLGFFSAACLYFGLNHAWYALCLTQGLIFLMAWRGALGSFRQTQKDYWIGYALCGSPLVFWVLADPGLREALLSIAKGLSLAGWGRSKMPITVEWPWNIPWAELAALTAPRARILETINRVSISLGYVTAVVTLVVGWVCMLYDRSFFKNKAGAVTAAALLVSTVYAHHYFVRADLAYLGEGWTVCIFLGVILASRAGRFWTMVATVFFLSLTLGAAGLRQPFMMKVFAKPYLTQVRLRQNTLWLERDQAAAIERLRIWAATELPRTDTFFVAPLAVVFYPVAERSSPARWTYFTLPMPPGEEDRLITELESKRVSWAFLGDPEIDGRAELRFSATHPKLWTYLMTHFVKDPSKMALVGYTWYQRRVETS